MTIATKNSNSKRNSFYRILEWSWGKVPSCISDMTNIVTHMVGIHDTLEEQWTSYTLSGMIYTQAVWTLD